MAEESKTIKKSAIYRYQLTLGNPIGKNSSGTIKLVQGRSVLLDYSDENSMYYVTLRGVKAYTFDSMKDGNGKMDDLNYKSIDKLSTGFPKDAFPKNATSNSELAHDEYFFPL